MARVGNVSPIEYNTFKLKQTFTILLLWCCRRIPSVLNSSPGLEHKAVVRERPDELLRNFIQEGALPTVQRQFILDKAQCPLSLSDLMTSSQLL